MTKPILKKINKLCIAGCLVFFSASSFCQLQVPNKTPTDCYGFEYPAPHTLLLLTYTKTFKCPAFFNKDKAYIKTNNSIPSLPANNYNTAFWNTQWAFILYALIFFSFTLVLYFNLQIHKQKKQLLYIKQNNALREKELNDLKISFFTNIAHEIKTPLTLIKTPLELILEKDKISNTDKADLQVMLKNVNRLSNLITQVVDVKKIEENNFKLNLKPINLNDIMNDVITLILSEAKYTDTEIRVNAHKGNLIVNADPTALSKVLRNIINSVISLSKKKVKIEISNAKNNYNQIIIYSNGTTIPELNNNKTPGPYQLLSSEKYKNFGVALVHSKKIIEEHGGLLEIKNNADYGFTTTIGLLSSKPPQAPSQNPFISKNKENV